MELPWKSRLGEQFGRAIVVDAQGNSYVAGGYCGQVIFAPGEANATTLNGINCSSFSRYDTFVAKYDSAGAFLWVVSATASGGIGTNPEIVVGGIGLDGSGNIYIDGWYLHTATFGLIFSPQPGHSTISRAW